MKHLLMLGGALLLGACQQQQQQSLVTQVASAPQVRGHELAKKACATCHAIERGSISSPNPQAPSFAVIVNQQGLTAETLSPWLRDAHNYPNEMQFELDPSKVDDLVEYMLTLRDPDFRPVG